MTDQNTDASRAADGSEFDRVVRGAFGAPTEPPPAPAGSTDADVDAVLRAAFGKN